MPTALVTGANSGIGHALAKILVKEVLFTLSSPAQPCTNTDQIQGYKVIAADIHLGPSVQALKCDTHTLDVSSPDSIQAFKQALNNQPIDLLLNIAGVMSPPEADALSTVDITSLEKTFAVNTFGPFLLTQALLPNILLSTNSRIAVMSSRVGSMGDNSTGGSYSYRASKAGVNSLFKSLAVDLKEKDVPVLVLHPGIVKTELDPRWKDGGDKVAPGAVEPDVAAGELWKNVLGKGMEASGRFWHRSGEELPW